MLADGSVEVDEEFNLKKALSELRGWKMYTYALICFTYAGAFATTSNFLPQIVGRLGFGKVKANLWTVAPNCVGVAVLLAVTYSSDHFRERTFHLTFALLMPLIGMIILICINVVEQKAVAYFAMFLMAAGSVSCPLFTPRSTHMLTLSSTFPLVWFTPGITPIPCTRTPELR